VLQIAGGGAAAEVAQSAQVVKAVDADGAPFSLRRSRQMRQQQPANTKTKRATYHV
jgi:hypothetical protein